MRNGNSAKVLFGSLFVITMLACNLGSSAQTQSQGTEPAVPQAAEENTTANAGCINPYYPVVKDASWSYKSTGSPVGEYQYTEVVSDVRADGFTVTSEHVEGFTRSMEWSCTPQGLVTTTPDDGMAGGIAAEQFKMDITTTGIEGVALPVQIKTGDQWTYTMTYTGLGNINGSEVTSEGTTVFTMNALGEESVTVPAGTFTAMKISNEIVLDVLMTYQGSTNPYPSKFSQINYWVAGVGLVKGETTADTGGSTYSEVIELQSYTLP